MTLRRAGRHAWALLGILAVAALLLYLASLLSLVVVPVILALFPATLLVPVSRQLQRWRFPATLAALTTVFGSVLVLLFVLGGMVMRAVSEWPELAESAGEGLRDLMDLLNRVFPDLQLRGFDDLINVLQERAAEGEEVAAQAADFTIGAFETMAGVLLVLVVLFFYLRSGRALAEGVAHLAPRRMRGRLLELAEGWWETLGGYFRGQILVALVDAVAIGVALLLLGIPLAVPLALLVFFGGMFPIVGAVVTGSVAVLVALAHAGLTMAVVVALIVLAVQQLEGNVLEPLILSRVIDLHPLAIILSITAGAVLMGILGAFLAVPVAAVVHRTLKEVRSDGNAARPSAPGSGG